MAENTARKLKKGKTLVEDARQALSPPLPSNIEHPKNDREKGKMLNKRLL